MQKITLAKVLKWLPLLAPLPEGYAVGLAIARELSWWMPFVVISALVVALTGFYGVYVRTQMSEFNHTLKKDEIKEVGKVQTWKADVVLAVWFAGVVMITVFLDTVPTLATLTPVALVVIGFGSNYLYALSNILATHEEARDAYRVTKRQEDVDARKRKEDERKEAQAERKAEKVKAQQMAILKQAIAQKINAAQDGKHPKRSIKTGSKLSDEMLLLEWAGSPYLTPAEMVGVLWDEGRGIKVSRQAISQRRDKMVERGLIVIEPDGRIVQPITSMVMMPEVPAAQ
jgi:ribosomal protein L9